MTVNVQNISNTKPRELMRNLSSFIAPAILAIGTLFMVGCESEDAKKISNAQNCLDHATSSTVSECTDIVSGMTSKESYHIRCSAHYISQGFTGARFASAFEQLKSSGSSVDPMTTAMAFMAFNSQTEADTTLSDCTASGVQSLLRMSTLTSLATVVASASANNLLPSVGTTGLTATQMQTAIQNLINTPSASTNQTIGTIAISAQAAYCNTGSSFATNEVCTNLNAAVNSGASAATIGAALLTQLNTVSH